MLSRLFLAAALLFGAAAFPAQAQTECVGGSAGAYTCDSVDLLGRLSRLTYSSPGNNDIWGWVDPQDGSEYALVGTQTSLVFVDVTDPTEPEYLGRMLTQTFSSTWRDVKVYADHAFVVADGAGDHGMQVFDLTRLRDLSGPPQFLTPDVVYNGVPGNQPGSTHNIVINEDTGLAALVGSEDCAGGLHLVDVTDPLNPEFQGCFSGDGYTHDAQCVVYNGPDTDYTGQEICFASNEDSVTMVNVTDPTDPQLISVATYPNPGYTHQGWLTEDQRFFIANDELDEVFGATTNTRTVVFDFADLDSPEFDFFYFGPLETSDHNLYIRGDYAYLSNYEGGLRILDLSGIESGTLTEVGSFDTYPDGDENGFSGQWSNYPFFPSGNIIANDGDTGLFILSTGLISTASTPRPAPAAPAALSLPVPNPATSGTTLTLTVAEAAEVTAEVLDLRGRRVALLHDGLASPAAPLALAVDTADLTAGLYLVRVTGPRFTATRRISVVH